VEIEEIRVQAHLPSIPSKVIFPQIIEQLSIKKMVIHPKIKTLLLNLELMNHKKYY
jgi:hypothetical protein